jgi:hypothetical protein
MCLDQQEFTDLLHVYLHVLSTSSDRHGNPQGSHSVTPKMEKIKDLPSEQFKIREH